MADAYFEDIAEYYDELWGEQEDQAEELAFLRAHGGAGPVLEVGVGTGRVAIPLAEAGWRVHGVDNSPAMLRRLAVKVAERGLEGSVTGQRTDLALHGVSGTYSLVFAVYHTIFYAHSRAEQAEFFQAASRLLTAGGKLVVEAYQVTEKRLARWRLGVHPVGFDETGVQLEFYDHQPHERSVRTGHLVVTAGRSRYSYHVDRYLWPDEMDRLATDAGFTLLSRSAGWKGEPFHPTKSGRSIVVYGIGLPG